MNGAFARRWGSWLVACALAALGTACDKHASSASVPPAPTPHPPPAAAAEPAVTPSAAKPIPDEPGTWYRARLVFDKVGELPFFLHVPPMGGKGHAFVVNGDEVADFTAEWRDNEITVNGVWNYTSTIEAELKPGTKTLKGQWTRDTPLWGAVVRDFDAVQIDKPDPLTRFANDGKPAAVNIAGTWKFDFAEHKEGKGFFEQGPDGVVKGYVKPGQLGDIRFLAGNLHGNKLAISTFNGNSANLVLADVSADGKSMSGLMSMQNVWNEKFTATRVDGDFHFVNKVHLKEGAKTVSLAGLDKYKGKPTLALIFATWCSSCNDAHPYFDELYATYHPQGLEVLGVDYDLTDDVKANQAQIETFRAKYKIPWEIVQVPCTPETWAKAMPPELEGWDGLPIILLIRPDGSVQTVLGGWFGPATGAEGDKLRTWFTDQTKQLVTEAKQPQHT